MNRPYRNRPNNVDGGRVDDNDPMDVVGHHHERIGDHPRTMVGQIHPGRLDMAPEFAGHHPPHPGPFRTTARAHACRSSGNRRLPRNNRTPGAARISERASPPQTGWTDHLTGSRHRHGRSQGEFPLPLPEGNVLSTVGHNRKDLRSHTAPGNRPRAQPWKPHGSALQPNAQPWKTLSGAVVGRNAPRQGARPSQRNKGREDHRQKLAPPQRFGQAAIDPYGTVTLKVRETPSPTPTTK